MPTTASGCSALPAAAELKIAKATRRSPTIPQPITGSFLAPFVRSVKTPKWNSQTMSIRLCGATGSWSNFGRKGTNKCNAASTSGMEE